MTNNKENIFSLKYSKCISNSISDHKIVLSELSFLNPFKIRKFKKNSDWKLNEQILENKKVNNYVLRRCAEIPILVSHYQKDWYEYFINDIINYLKIQSRIINTQKKNYINSLFYKLSILNIDQYEEREKIKKEIKLYYEDERKGIERRACETKRNFIYQPTKVLIEKEIRNAKKNYVKKFKKETSQITEDQDEMLSEVSSFYSQLLSVDKVSQDSLQNYKFLIKPLNEIDDKINIGYEITYVEAEEVVMKMNDSSPGPNGLTIGFFKKYFKYFGQYFIDILNSHQEALPKTFMESKIKLIPKNKKETKGVNDLRPISLTNLEYRIFTKILAKRFRLIGHKIIQDHQTCSIFGRRMNDNIWLLSDILEDSNRRKKELDIILADQQKAFDSISHVYIFALIKHLNLGDFIFNNIKRIYNNSSAKIV